MKFGLKWKQNKAFDIVPIAHSNASCVGSAPLNANVKHHAVSKPHK